MTTVGQAVADLKINLTDHETVCIVIRKGDRYVQYHLNEVADQEIGDDTFVSTGTFPVATNFHQEETRTAANVLRVWAIPLDADLKDFLDVENGDLWKLEENELDVYRKDLQHALEETCRHIGWPIHRLDSTGYGIAAYTYLPVHEPKAVEIARGFHAQIVDRINKVWHGKLVDPGVKDAGSRIMRLVPCQNAKAVAGGGPRRQSRTIYFNEITHVDSAVMEYAAGGPIRSVGNTVPRTGKSLSEDMVERIVGCFSPYWSQGQKHFMGNAVSGWLAKNGVPEEQALGIIERLSVDDRKQWDRRKSVRDAYDRYRNGLSVRGFYALREMVDANELQAIDDILARFRSANTGTLRMGGSSIGTANSPRATSAFTPPPAGAFRGWIGNYVDLMTPTTEAPKAFHLGVGLTIAGAILGRDTWADYGEPTHANLFTLLIGRSGRTRKDTSIRRGTRMISDQHITNQGKLAGTITSIITDIGSAEALMDALSEKPNLMLYATEFSKLMGNARRKATGTIIPTLMQAWDAPITMSVLTRGNPVEASFPYLTVLAATQPEILANLMSEDDVFSGFANRWFYVCGEPTSTPIANPPSVDAVVAASLYNDLKYRRAEAADVTRGFSLSREAFTRWQQWYDDDYYRESATPEEDAMRPRHAPLIRKIALIYAATEGHKQIEVDHLDAAISVIEWMGENVRSIVGTWGVSPLAKLEQRILDVLAVAPNSTMKRRDLQRKAQYRGFTGLDFKMTLEGLKANDRVLIDANNVVSLVLDDEPFSGNRNEEAS